MIFLSTIRFINIVLQLIINQYTSLDVFKISKKTKSHTLKSNVIERNRI